MYTYILSRIFQDVVTTLHTLSTLYDERSESEALERYHVTKCSYPLDTLRNFLNTLRHCLCFQ